MKNYDAKDAWLVIDGKKVAGRYGTGPSLFTNEELETLFGSH